jgi:MarR family transcriptional regulator for hemolysin
MSSQATQERFSMALHNAARTWRQALDRRLKDLGIGQAGWLAVAMIAKSATPPSQTELAGRIGVEDPTMVATVDRLVKAGLVERVASERDRRVKLVTLTADGQALYAKLRQQADAFRAELLAGIDERTLLAAAELLEGLRDAAEGAQ